MIRSRSVLFLCLLCAAAAPLTAQRVRGGSVSLASSSTLVRPFVLDFETEDDLVTPLANGQAISAAEFGRHVRISASGANAGAAIFDSTPGGPNDPSQDLDLLVGLGNVLILQNSQASAQSVPGVFDRPNDDQDGGSLVLDFETPTEPLSVLLVDVDAGASQPSRVTLRDEAGLTRVYTIPAGWTRDLLADGAPATRRLFLRTLRPQPGFASTATATEDAGFDARRTVQLVVALGGSGAVGDARWSPGRSLGMIVSNDEASFFDADSDERIGVVTLPDWHGGPACAVDARRALGYANGNAGRIWLYDLYSTPPTLAAGINPIVPSGFSYAAGDMSLSPDGRFLALATSFPSVVVIDLDTRLEAGRAGTLSSTSLDFADERNVVVALDEPNPDRLERFTLDAAGVPSSTGETLALRDPWKVACAPGGRSGVAVARSPSRIVSFRVAGMTQVSQLDLPEPALSVAMSPDGRWISVTYQEFPNELRRFDPLTGEIGETVGYLLAYNDHLDQGLESSVFHPDGTRVYTSSGSRVFVQGPNGERGEFWSHVDSRSFSIGRGFR